MQRTDSLGYLSFCFSKKSIFYDILALLVRYIGFANAIYPHYVQMRYNINLVAVRQHIAP